MNSPYQDLPANAFWRTAVAQKDALAISGLWDPKCELLATDKIATFGSCFAQHIGQALAGRNFNWLDAEPPPQGLAPEAARERNYGIFSARTGNIYTAAAFRQWLEWALGLRRPPDEVWEKDARYFDPFRPAIEPAGFASSEELLASRVETLHALKETIIQSNHLVFTLGLTEAWINREEGYVYAMCPGTSAGEFDAGKHAFRNFVHAEVLMDMQAAIALLRSVNARINVLLTVSPVPLTATASGSHVVTATTYSKSVLRGVAGELSSTIPCVDYFPSYEIISGVPFRGRFFAPNLRTVTAQGVEFVMQSFFACLNARFGKSSLALESGGLAPGGTDRFSNPEERARDSEEFNEGEDLVCEEEMLAAFAPGSEKSQAARPRADAQRICVIGNSHIGALRWAIKKGQFSDPGMDIVFWGFPGRKFLDVKFENGRLIHPDKTLALMVSDGRFAAVHPRQFDVLLFVGGGMSVTAALWWMTRAGPFDDAKLYRLLRARALKSHVMTLMKSIARVYRGRIIYVPTPLISEESEEKGHIQVAPEELARFNRIFEKVFEDVGIAYIRQPPETIRNNIWTQSEYSTGSGGIRAINPDLKGHKHANHLYGSLILSAVRERLRRAG